VCSEGVKVCTRANSRCRSRIGDARSHAGCEDHALRRIARPARRQLCRSSRRLICLGVVEAGVVRWHMTGTYMSRLRRSG